MSNKNYSLLLVSVFTLISSLSIAQMSDVTKQWKDSSKVATKNSAQFTEFSKNAYIYPAKPRDMWEIGVGLGIARIGGDINSNVGLTASLSARKSLGHVFSLRPYLSYAKIYGDEPANNINGAGNPAATNVARPYKTTTMGLGIDGIASLNTSRNYKGNPKVNIYVLGGIGVIGANVEKKATNGTYVQFDPSVTNAPLTTINDGKTAVIPVINLGIGIAFRVSDRFNIGLENKNSITSYDYLDGFHSSVSNTFDGLNAYTLRLNFNVGSRDKRVEPLNWINPNNYVYSELNEPDHLKKNLKVKLDDADGDGITDQFDLEPNTPAGVAVDSRGRALDSDGDGVPDYKDKELLTRQECFPVNTEGVGSCPESACCKESREKITELQKVVEGLKESGIAGSCSMNNLPSIVFKSGGASLSRDNMRLLDAVATQMKDNPSCKVKVLGHPEANKSSQQKSYDRVDAIIKYLVEKQGISENRFIFAYDSGSGDSKTIDLQGTTEAGPNTVPAPAPHLKGKQNY
ncbi:MAG: OmpA family protein [Chitinophagaceae bacterium]|nr:OmpA family protein [Chitinophagaceae bacterium]